MDANARWINKARTVIYYTFSGIWDWEDFYLVFDQGAPCDPAQNVCALIDLRAVTQLPSDAILHLKRAAQIAERATGLIIIIATSVHAVMLYQLFITLYKVLHDKFRLVSTEDEAYAILQMPD